MKKNEARREKGPTDFEMERCNAALNGGWQRHYWCFSYVISEYWEGNGNVCELDFSIDTPCTYCS